MTDRAISNTSNTSNSSSPSAPVAVRRARTAHLHSLFERAMHDSERSLIGWSVAMVLLAAYLLAFFPTVSRNTEMSRLIETYPEAIRKIMLIRDFTTGPGFLQAEGFSFMIPLLVLIPALLNGSDATCGEEDRRTIDVLLACPISRTRVVVEKFAALVAGLAIVTAALLLTLLVGAPLVDLHVGVDRLLAAGLATWLLAVSIGSIAMFLGAATGRRGVARGVTAFVVVAGYLISGLAGLVPALMHVRPLSLYHHSLGIEPLYTGFSVVHSSILVGVTAMFLGLAVFSFERRDLAQ